MQDFRQWLAERGKRTALGIYPSLYGGIGGRPPLDNTACCAGAVLGLIKNHGDEQPDLLKPEFKKQRPKHKKGRLPRWSEKKAEKGSKGEDYEGKKSDKKKKDDD